MRNGVATIVMAAAMLAGCGMAPAAGSPELMVKGPSEAVGAFVRQQGAHRPTRATTFPRPAGDGQATARVLMPAGTGTAAMQALAREATNAGLAAAIVTTK